MVVFLFFLILAFILIPMRKRVRNVLATLVVAGTALISWPNIYESFQLENYGQHTTGILIEKFCEVKRSSTITYKFLVNRISFIGKGNPGSGNQSCELFKVGDQVFVTYLLVDPNVSRPERAVSSEIFIWLILLIVFFLLLLWFNSEQHNVRSKKEKRKKKIV